MIRSLGLGWLAVGCATGCAIEPAPPCDVGWDDVGRGFTLEYCDACHAATATDRHGAPASVTFDTEAEAEAFADRIAARVDAGDMPPGGGVSDDDLDALAAWLDCVAAD
ncbi:MAG: c-type cytochrome [Myxococcota bacterium]